MENGLTVKQLLAECQKQIKAGNGDKHILISQDDEGNGLHTLFYGFTSDKENIKEYAEAEMFHDSNDVDDVVLLG